MVEFTDMQNFSGVWTALITPMTEQGVDYDALKKLEDALDVFSFINY